MDALKELKWVIGIVVAIGFIWLVSGGPQSLTKTSPTIKPVSDSSAGTDGGWFGFLFPGLGNATSSRNRFSPVFPNQNQPSGTLPGKTTPGSPSSSVNSPTKTTTSGSGTTGTTVVKQ